MVDRGVLATGPGSSPCSSTSRTSWAGDPEPDAPVADVIGRALEMVANTCPFDVSGHPACSVPAGLVEGLPAGLMIVGRRFDDAGVLRVAHAYESTTGGFPTPPGKE